MYTIQMPDNKAFADLNFFEKFQKTLDKWLWIVYNKYRH